MKHLFTLIICVASYYTILAQNHNSKEIIDGYRDIYGLSYIEMPFMASELIEIYKKDTTIISEYFHSIEEREKSSSCRKGSLCLYDCGAKALVDSLQKLKNINNANQIDKMISKIGCMPPKKAGIDWGLVFLGCEDCNECPFSDYGPECRFYEKSSLIYMGEDEIMQMITFENGEQWGYMLRGIEGGDYFYIESSDPACREINRRIMQFLINKWSPYQIPEVQELVKVLKESLPLNELANPVDLIKGTWRGAFGNKTINLTIDYDASVADEEKAEAKRTRWEMFTDECFGVLAKSIFDGQSEGKVVSSKGYYTDGGKDIRIKLIEQPDTAQWNGEFNLWVNRKTNKMHGTWESNNKKLKREFELEKISE